MRHIQSIHNRPPPIKSCDATRLLGRCRSAARLLGRCRSATQPLGRCRLAAQPMPLGRWADAAWLLGRCRSATGPMLLGRSADATSPLSRSAAGPMPLSRSADAAQPLGRCHSALGRCRSAARLMLLSRSADAAQPLCAGPMLLCAGPMPLGRWADDLDSQLFALGVCVARCVAGFGKLIRGMVRGEWRYGIVPYERGCLTSVVALRAWLPYERGCLTSVVALRAWLPYERQPAGWSKRLAGSLMPSRCCELGCRRRTVFEALIRWCDIWMIFYSGNPVVRPARQQGT